MSKDFKSYDMVPPSVRRINTFQSSEPEYYTAPDKEGVDARMTTIRNLSKTEFKLRITLDYWRLFPEKGFKYKLYGQYWWKISTHHGIIFNDIYSADATGVFADLIRIMLLEMIDYYNMEVPDGNVFPKPTDDYILRLARSLPHCVQN